MLSSTQVVPRDTGQGSWTVLVYLNADNDLEPYSILNMNQMETVGSSNRLHIVVQMDRSPHYDTSNGNWIGCRRYLVTRDNDTNIINSTVLQDMGNVDMGSPDTLRDFIAWGEQHYPATHYCLVIWNHGSGWRLRQTTQSITRNVSFDDTSGTSISTTDLAYALSSSPQPIDLLAFDASLMQMLEVAYELRNSAKYVVGSEESPPGEGYVYNDWLTLLAQAPSMSPSDLGKTICRTYVNDYIGRYDVTQSLLDMSKLSAVAAATDELGAALIPNATSKSTELAAARQNSQHYVYTYYKDLLDYADKAKAAVPDPAVAAACQHLHAAIAAAIAYEAHTGASVANSKGLSIYVPQPADYLARYSDLHISQDYPNWSAWLRSEKE